MLVASVDWTKVLLGLIAIVPTTVSCLMWVYLHSQIKTPSGTSIGRQVENALHTALANNYHLRSIGGTVDAPAQPEATAEEAKVPGLPGSEG